MNNIFNILQWDAQRNLNLLRKPVDKGTGNLLPSRRGMEDFCLID